MKAWKVIVIALAAVIVTNGVGGYFWWSSMQSQKKQLNDEIAVLNTTLTAIGDMVTVYTVASNVRAGDEVTESSLQTMSMPSSTVGDNYITDSSEVIGKYYKVSLSPLTPLTDDCFMEDELDDTVRDIDIVVDRWTVGLQEGDYIDLRITLPRGDDYVVLSHLRVRSMGQATLKVYLTEEQWHQYVGALVDYYLNSQFGASIYAVKYVEPGVQAPAICYYAVPESVENAMLLDPNIVDKAVATANHQLREPIDKIFNEFHEKKTRLEKAQEDGGLLAGGRSTYNSAINSDASVAKDFSSEGDEGDGEEDDPYAGWSEADKEYYGVGEYAEDAASEEVIEGEEGEESPTEEEVTE